MSITNDRDNHHGEAESSTEKLPPEVREALDTIINYNLGLNLAIHALTTQVTNQLGTHSLDVTVVYAIGPFSRRLRELLETMAQEHDNLGAELRQELENLQELENQAVPT